MNVFRRRREGEGEERGGGDGENSAEEDRGWWAQPDSLNLDTYVSTRVFKTAPRNDV